MLINELLEDAYTSIHTNDVYWRNMTPAEQAEWTKRAKSLEVRLNSVYKKLQSVMNPEDVAALKGVKLSVPMNGEMAWAAADYQSRTLTVDVGTFWDLSDDCLAYVTGHEIGHFVYEAKNKGYWKKRMTPAQNRQFEMDADVYGAILAYKLGYNPKKAWDQFTLAYQREAFDPKQPSYPSVGQRKANLNKSIQDYKAQQAQPAPSSIPQQEPQQPPEAAQPAEPPLSPGAKQDLSHAMHGIQQLSAALSANPELAQGPMPSASQLA